MEINSSSGILSSSRLCPIDFFGVGGDLEMWTCSSSWDRYLIKDNKKAIETTSNLNLNKLKEVWKELHIQRGHQTKSFFGWFLQIRVNGNNFWSVRIHLKLCFFQKWWNFREDEPISMSDINWIICFVNKLWSTLTWSNNSQRNYRILKLRRELFSKINLGLLGK